MNTKETDDEQTLQVTEEAVARFCANRRIETALPGFVGLHEFFRQLPGSFRAISLDASEKERYRMQILEISGSPSDLVEMHVWAWYASARAYEVRRYSDGTLTIRFGVRSIDDDLRFDKDELQLMIAFGEDADIRFYTLLYGTGLQRDGGTFTYSNPGHLSSRHDVENDWDSLDHYMQKMGDDEYFIVGDRSHQHQYVQALGGYDGKGVCFYFEYCLCDFSWAFTTPKHVSREELIRLVHVYRDGGFPALQDATEWRQMDARGYWQYHQKKLCVDQWLTALGYRLQATDPEVARRCRELTARISPDRKPLAVSVKPGSKRKMLDEVLSLAHGSGRFTDAERYRLNRFVELVERYGRW